MKKSQKPTLSIYIHIPFCQKKCAYCDFLSFDNRNETKELYIEALIREIQRDHHANDFYVKSIFFGGGTPSTLTPSQMKEIMASILGKYELTKDCEISMECNPGTLSQEKITTMKAIGINRISMGVQSFDLEMLGVLGRIHTDTVFYKQYKDLREAGYENINLDLMYGLPNQTVEKFKKQLEILVKLNPEHVSTYGLIVEKETQFEQLYHSNPDIFPDEDAEREMYWMAHKYLINAGYIHYEISNYAKPGYVCKHNDVYWLVEPYIGFGLGAASFIDGKRFDRMRDLDQYIVAHDTVEQNSLNIMDKEQLYEEVMFLGLRRFEGVTRDHFKELCGISMAKVYGDIITKLEQQKLLIADELGVRLTHKGIDISNYVMSQFLL